MRYEVGWGCLVEIFKYFEFELSEGCLSLKLRGT